jgi:hypothetical protein
MKSGDFIRCQNNPTTSTFFPENVIATLLKKVHYRFHKILILDPTLDQLSSIFILFFNQVISSFVVGKNVAMHFSSHPKNGKRNVPILAKLGRHAREQSGVGEDSRIQNVPEISRLSA